MTDSGFDSSSLCSERVRHDPFVFVCVDVWIVYSLCDITLMECCGWSEFERAALWCVASPWVLHPEAVTQVSSPGETIELTSLHSIAVWQSSSHCQSKLTHPDTDLALHQKPTVRLYLYTERTDSWIRCDMGLDPYLKTKRDRIEFRPPLLHTESLKGTPHQAYDVP